MVAVEQADGDAGRARAHYVVGTTRRGGGAATVKVAAGTCGLGRDTYFKFFWSSSVDLATLTREALWKGRLEPGQVVEIDKAIRASRLGLLKKARQPRRRRRSRPAPRRAPSGRHRS